MRREDMMKRIPVVHEFEKYMRDRLNDPHLILFFNKDTKKYEVWSEEGGLHYVMVIETARGTFREPTERDVNKLQQMAWNRRQSIIREMEEYDDRLRKEKKRERKNVRHELVKDYHKALDVMLSCEDDINRSQVLVDVDLK